jgi:hypothetical protein
MASLDTRPEARDAQLAALERLGPAARVELAFEMSAAARRIAIEAIRSRDPTVSPLEARFRLLRRLLGEKLFSAAYGQTRV